MQKIMTGTKTFGSRVVVLILTLAIAFSCVFSMSTSKALADDSYKTWKQFGEEWSSMTLGSGGKTVAKVGCAVTSLAMLCVHSGAVTDENFNPGVLVQFLNSDGAFSRDGSIKWSKVSDYAPALNFKSMASVSYSSESAALSAMKGYLNSGYYVLIRVNNSGSTHFVTLDYVNNSDIYMMDPGKTGATNLFDTYGYSKITGIRLFTSANGDPRTLITDGTSEEGETAVEEEVETESIDTISSSASAVLNSSGDVLSSESSDFLAGTYKTIAALNLRVEASVDAEKYLVIPKNTKLEITVTTLDGWGQVTYKDQTGWVNLNYVK